MEMKSLKKGKVALRAAEPGDVDLIYAWENNIENWLVSNTIAPYNREQIKDFIANSNDLFVARQLRLMIECDGCEQPVGCIDLYDFDPKNHRIGVGVLIDTDHRGNGYAGDALELAVDYCFDVLDVHCVYAEIIENNQSSVRLFEKLHFERTGVRCEWFWDGENYLNQYIYQRLRR
ncbi:MAG: GNAT family N-acetyltransferase [Salibacteraceae bacterium]